MKVSIEELQILAVTHENLAGVYRKAAGDLGAVEGVMIEDPEIDEEAEAVAAKKKAAAAKKRKAAAAKKKAAEAAAAAAAAAEEDDDDDDDDDDMDDDDMDDDDMDDDDDDDDDEDDDDEDDEDDEDEEPAPAKNKKGKGSKAKSPGKQKGDVGLEETQVLASKYVRLKGVPAARAILTTHKVKRVQDAKTQSVMNKLHRAFTEALAL